MKKYSLKHILFIISVMLAVAITVIMIFWGQAIHMALRNTPLFLFLISITSLLLLLLIMNRLLFKKINQLHETVKNYRANGDNPSSNPDYTNNEIHNLDLEIKAWEEY